MRPAIKGSGQSARTQGLPRAFANENSMTVKLLIKQHLEFLSLKGGCTGSSESTLVKMPTCWKSHVTAQIKNGAAALFDSKMDSLTIVLLNILKDFRNAPPAKMLVYCQNVIF